MDNQYHPGDVFPSPFLKVLENSSDMIVSVDSTGRFTQVNPAVEKTIGYLPEEVLNKHYTEFLHVDSITSSEATRKSIMLGNEVKSFDNIFIHKNGFEVYINWSAYWSETDQAIFCIGRDISEQKSFNDQVKQNQTKYQALFEQSSDSIMITDFKGNFLDVNTSLCQLFDYKREELLKMNIRQLLEAEQLADRPIAFDRIKDGVHIFNDRKMIKRDGSIVNVMANVKRLDDNSIVAIATDISETLLMDQAKKETEEQLRLFVKHSPAALAMFDTQMNYIVTSDRWIKDYGLEDKDLKGKNHYEVFKGIPERWKDIHNRCLQGLIEKNDEDHFIDNNGVQQWNRWEIHPWYKSNMELGGIIMFTEVITKIKEAERKFRDLVENPLVGVFIIQNERLAYVNKALAATFGYTPSELLNSKLLDSIVFEEDFNLVAEKILKQSEIGDENLNFEFKGKHKDGSLVWVEIFSNPTIINGSPASIGSMVDISKRKAAEAENERTSRMLKERIKELTALYHVGQELQVEDQALEEQLQQIVAKLPAGWQYPDITAARIVFSGFTFSTPNFKDSEFSQVSHFETSDGRSGLIEVVYLEKMPEMQEGPFLSEERTLIDMMAEMLQIYISRRIEANALQKSEANLKTIFENTETIYVLSDPELQIVSYNNVALKFVKKELGIAEPKTTSLREYFSPDKLDFIQANLAEVYNGREVVYEADYRKTDGSGICYLVKINPVLNDENEFMGILLALNDITNQKNLADNTGRQIALFKEMSFILSHELRHEYLKLHGVVNLLTQAENVDSELKSILTESTNTFDRINDSIFKLNDKISVLQNH